MLIIFLNPKCVQKAKRSYQKDVANFKEARDSHALDEDEQESKFAISICVGKKISFKMSLQFKQAWFYFDSGTV